MGGKLLPHRPPFQPYRGKPAVRNDREGRGNVGIIRSPVRASTLPDSRYRTGHGAKNMTIVRRFALGLVRANKAKGSVKTRRKTAGWSPDFLLEILQLK